LKIKGIVLMIILIWACPYRSRHPLVVCTPIMHSAIRPECLCSSLR